MDMEQYVRELMKGKNGRALRALTESGDGAALSKQFDGAAIERAAKSGDTAALSAILKNVLSTPEGARFAEQVKKAVDGGGR